MKVKLTAEFEVSKRLVKEGAAVVRADLRRALKFDKDFDLLTAKIELIDNTTKHPTKAKPAKKKG